MAIQKGGIELNGYDIWEILGIQPVKDPKAVKRAYAKKCRTCHPEEAPEEFDRLHQAYEAALAYCSLEETDEKIERLPHKAGPYSQTEETREDNQAAKTCEMDFDGLIRQGLEAEAALSDRRLMEAVRQLHKETDPDSDLYQNQFEEALWKWKDLLTAPENQSTLRSQDFMARLCLWFMRNEHDLWHAEVVAVAIAYDLKDFQHQYPDPNPLLTKLYSLVLEYTPVCREYLNLYAEMRLASRSEWTSVEQAAIPPPEPYKPSKAERVSKWLYTAGTFFMVIYLSIIATIIFITGYLRSR